MTEKLTSPSRLAPLRRPKRPDKAPKRDRDDWLQTARRVLIAEGVERVKIEPLATLLGVTTGSFYHHFKNRSELLGELLKHWEAENTAPMVRAVEEAGGDANRQLNALFDTWLAESDYDPTYDSAVRAWARSSKTAEEVVRRVDDERIDLLRQIFLRLGYDEDRAFVRARIAYFHQVGYQAMKVIEDRAERLRLQPFYREALIGDC